MKKSIIKRRKRVVPAPADPQTQSGEGSEMMVLDTTEHDRPSPPRNTQRGSVNPDGSISLGFRPRGDQARTLPDPSGMRPQNSPAPKTTNYLSDSILRDPLDSLNNNNRLPPMTSYPSPTQNRPSLSPNSFLSPSRKRSFASVEQNQQPTLPRTNSGPNPQSSNTQTGGRLSDIKSLLNPSGYADAESGGRRSPYHAPSPGSSSNYPPILQNAPNEPEQAKLERREMLRRERERMHEALKANERELEELGHGD